MDISLFQLEGKTVSFLVSDLAGYVTGHTLHVNGGWMVAYLPGVPEIPAMGVLGDAASTTKPTG